MVERSDKKSLLNKAYLKTANSWVPILVLLIGLLYLPTCPINVAIVAWLCYVEIIYTN